MSCIYKGSVIETNLSQNSSGGTEQMRARLLANVDQHTLSNFAIHLSRPRQIFSDVKNIFWAHDLANDSENDTLLNNGYSMFDHFVFVSKWQQLEYITKFGIPYEQTSIIENAIESPFNPDKDFGGPIRFIYHTTPHRGLELLVPIFRELTKVYSYVDLHLDVFSSFELYGWKERDSQYKPLFDEIQNNYNMTYHGSVSNSIILDYLKKSHIFLYPCIWKETSCLALIEAMMNNCICIHPNYGALSETASGNTFTFDFKDDINYIANTAFNMTRYVLNNISPSMFNVNEQSLSKFTIKEFTSKWNNLLTSQM